MSEFNAFKARALSNPRVRFWYYVAHVRHGVRRLLRRD